MSEVASAQRRPLRSPTGIVVLLAVTSVFATTIFVLAASAGPTDGPGTVGSWHPNATIAGSSTSVDFTYSAVANGEMILEIPTGWTPPTLSNVTLGFPNSHACSSTSNVNSPSGQTIHITFTCGNNDKFTVAYLGTAPQTVGSGTFKVYTAASGTTPTLLAKGGSQTVSVDPAAANKLAFTQQPGGGTSATTWTTQPKVSVQDQFGNLISGSTASIDLATTSGTGFGCTQNPVTAVSGVATFAGCQMQVPGTYALTATSSGLSPATSNDFPITKYSLTAETPQPQTYFDCSSGNEGHFGADVTFVIDGYRAGATGASLAIGTTTFTATPSGSSATFTILATDTVGTCPPPGTNRQIPFTMTALYNSSEVGDGSDTYTTTFADH